MGTKISDLTEKTNPNAYDWIPIVDNDGSPITKKARIGNMLIGSYEQGAYGVEWDEVNDSYQRLGALAGFPCSQSLDDILLPIQAQMRRCVISDAGVVQYYLDAGNSALKEDGVTASKLDGTDGQVMVEIPKFYYKYERFGNKHRRWISPTKRSGFELHPAFRKGSTEYDHRYIGAYPGVLRDVSALIYANGLYETGLTCNFDSAEKKIIVTNGATKPFARLEVGDKITISGSDSNNGNFTVTSKVSDLIITVSEAIVDGSADSGITITTQKDFTATTGDKLASISGKAPITYITRAQARQLAKNRGAGWHQFDFNLISAVQLLYLTEYADFNSQAMISAGNTKFASWNLSTDVQATGKSNADGNGSGGQSTTNGASSDYVSYRGIEDIFGNIWQFIDGINIRNYDPLGGTNYASYAFLCGNPTNFADDTLSNYELVPNGTLSEADGYISALIATKLGFLPKLIDISSGENDNICDYYYTDFDNNPNGGWRVVLVGGDANDGGRAGVFYVASDFASSPASSTFGARLCF